MPPAITTELSSIGSTVDAVRERVAGLSVPLRSGQEDLAAALFEAERSLRTAARHLERAKRLAG